MVKDTEQMGPWPSSQYLLQTSEVKWEVWNFNFLHKFLLLNTYSTAAFYSYTERFKNRNLKRSAKTSRNSKTHCQRHICKSKTHFTKPITPISLKFHALSRWLCWWAVLQVPVHKKNIFYKIKYLCEEINPISGFNLGIRWPHTGPPNIPFPWGQIHLSHFKYTGFPIGEGLF